MCTSIDILDVCVHVGLNAALRSFGTVCNDLVEFWGNGSYQVHLPVYKPEELTRKVDIFPDHRSLNLVVRICSNSNDWTINSPA